ncbi:MAG: type II toxin-antitoxin system HicA family toxin [Acidobacteriota bacterium]|nr:type II toxin-antitoxin system HicA family toxin [Acidobacteriota bacterium]
MIAELEQNGFKNRGGKGSHRNYEHILGVRLTISGKLGDDARKYQVKLVKDSIKKVK